MSSRTGLPITSTPSSTVAPDPVSAQQGSTATAHFSGPKAWQAGAGIKVMLSFLFLLLVPFWISLGPMLLNRFAHGAPPGTVGLVVIAVALTVLLWLVTAMLIQAIRSRVEVGEKGFRITLPKGRALLPMWRYQTRQLAFEDVLAVETRHELYGAPLIPVVMVGARVIPRVGPPINLGYVNAHDVDPPMPTPVIASEIARRAGIVVTDRGGVHRSIPRKLLGMPARLALSAGDPGVAREVIQRHRSRHDNWMRGLLALLVALVLIGIGRDWMQESAGRRIAADKPAMNIETKTPAKATSPKR